MASLSAREFALDLRRFNALSFKQIETAFRKLALAVDTEVVLMTPVDTGRARANWFCSINVPSDATTDSVDITGSSSLAQIRSTIVNAQLGTVIWLTNNLPYILPLEDGWSDQSPAGMVRVVFDKYKGLLR